MNIAFNFKNFEPSDHLKEYARTRFEKITKYIDDSSDNSEIQVNLSVEKFRHMAEVNLVADYLHLSAYQESEDMYSSIDLVLDKLEAQAKKMRERVKDKRKARKEAAVHTEIFSFIAGESGERERTIVETDQYEPKPMDVEEAAMQLETRAQEFLVFRNAATDRINVIYRRKNNDFGLIDPGA